MPMLPSPLPFPSQELGIAKLLQRSMGSLSGGEERRVALAAALVDLPQTDLLILDEPLGVGGSWNQGDSCSPY